MPKIGAVIPTRFYPHTLDAVLKVLDDDGVYTYLQRSDQFGHNIHKMWNNGVVRAREDGCEFVAILNDDIILQPGTIPYMASMLATYGSINVLIPETRLRQSRPIPDRMRFVEETVNNGGYAFMFRTDDPLIPEFPEEYHLWHGDLMFFDTIRARHGIVATAAGLWIGHLQSHSIKRIMGSAATDERGGPGLVARLQAAVDAGEEDARPLLEDTLRSRALHAERTTPPPGRRWSWEQEQRLRKAGR